MSDTKDPRVQLALRYGNRHSLATLTRNSQLAENLRN